jgi:hypothetical protein
METVGDGREGLHVTLLEPDSFTVVKVDASDAGDRFIILFGNPQASDPHGYRWTSSALMHEADLVDELSAWGLSSVFIVRCIRAAREGYGATGHRSVP